MPVLEDLPAELERARSCGAPFADAWSPGTAVVLGALGRGEASDSGGVLTATAGAWASAYEGTPATRGEVAASMLAHREPGVALEQEACRR